MTGIEVPALSIPKVALVTGGGSGIGKATAARLHGSGHLARRCRKAAVARIVNLTSSTGIMVPVDEGRHL